MKRTTGKLLSGGALLAVIFTATASVAQDGAEPLGGQPPMGVTASIKDFDYQIKYQRAFEAVLWNIPAAAIYSFRRAAVNDLDVKDNDIIAYSAPVTPKLEAITANSTTPYITAFTDLRKGPVVLELPPASADGSVYGQVVDAWQLTIADVGPSGLDKGQGGKLLFTPPGYQGAIPDGYVHIASPNFRIAFAFRSVPAPGKSVADAYRYAQKLRMYYLSEAADPPPQRFVDPINDRYPTLPRYDEHAFEDMHAIISVEPVKPQDKVTMGMLASLGIEKGKPFAPDETTKRVMRQAAIDVWFYLQQWFDNIPREKLYWPDRHYASLLQADRNKTFTFVYDDRIDLIGRAAEYFWCTTAVRLKTEQIQLFIFYVAIGIVGSGQKCSSYRQLFEYCHRKDLHQCVERCRDVQPFADDGDQDIHRHRDPDLRLHGVFRRAIEPLDPQVLFDPLEEKLHLPAALVEVANR
jgi:hypothetical protein